MVIIDIVLFFLLDVVANIATLEIRIFLAIQFHRLRVTPVHNHIRFSEGYAVSSGRVKKRQSLLDTLLIKHLRDKELTIEDIREEVGTFTSARHETTATCK